MARIPDITTRAVEDFDADAAFVIAEKERQRDATDAIRATTAHTRGLNDISRAIGAEPDFTKHAQMFEREAKKLTARSGDLIGNEELRKNFLGQAKTRTNAFRTRVLANVVRSEFEAARGEIDTALQTHFELYTDVEAQETERVQALAQIDATIALAGARGLFTPDEAEEKRQRFVIGAVREDAALQAARDPRGFLAELEVKNGRYAVLPAETRVGVARAAAGQAVAAAIDADPARVVEVLGDPLVAKNLDQEQQDKARDDARIRLEAQDKAKRTDEIMELATETPALVARARGNETFTDIKGTPQPAGPPLSVAEVNAARTRLSQGGAKPEVLQLHEELHEALIAQGGAKQARLEPQVFGELMQSISAARIVAGKPIDVEASVTRLVDVQGRVLRAQREGRITNAQAESLLTRVIPAVMAGIDRAVGMGGAGPLSGIAAYYDRALDFVGDLLAATGQEDNPEVTVPVFTAVEETAENNREKFQFVQAGVPVVPAVVALAELAVGFLARAGITVSAETLKRSLSLQTLRLLGREAKKRAEETPGQGAEGTPDFDTHAGIDANADVDVVRNAGETPDQEEERAEESASDGALINRLTDDPQEQDEIRNFLETPGAQRDVLGKELKSFADDKAFVEQVIAEKKLNIGTEVALGLRLYTDAKFATALNKRLREGRATLADKKLTALIAKGLRGLSRHKGEIWRAPRKSEKAGDELWNSAVVGEPLNLGFQFQSFSTDKAVAACWAGESRVAIHARSAPRGVSIEQLSRVLEEREVLLQPGLTYRVVGRRTENIVLDDGTERKMRIIEVEIVDAR